MQLKIFYNDCLVKDTNNLDILTVGDLKKFLEQIPDNYQIAVVEEEFVNLVVAYVTTDITENGTNYVKMGFDPDDLLLS